MNDPHVVALIYKLEHSQAVDYLEAKPIDHEEPDFHVKIANEQVRFEFKKHHATAKAAQKAIEEWFLTQMCARFSPSRSAAPWEEAADALVPANQR